MRITTKVIQNNSLNNINTNKLLQDKLSQQMSTEKKVNRPSDDPIVAIRALRLRTNVNQINQYYEKNVPDAESWLEVTESALSSMGEVVTDMIDQCIKGSNEDLTTEDRETILTALKALRDEVYATGNSDYAGRYVFTGYRTDTPLTFETGTEQLYTITEQINNGKIDKITYVDSGDVLKVHDANFDQMGNIKEQDVAQSEIHRIRLAYDNLVGKEYEVTDADGNTKTVAPITFTDDKGQEITLNGNSIVCESMSMYGDPNANPPIPDPYKRISMDPYKDNFKDKVILVKETGELLLGENVYNELMKKADDISTTDRNEGEFRITYQKQHWNGNDLRPEHYYACETVKEGKTITYNGEYLEGISDEEKQVIEYDVGLNQRIRVNTTADEVFTHDINRDVEDMIRTMEDTVAMQKQVEELKKILEAEKLKDHANNANNVGILEKQLAAAEKAFTFLNEKTQKMFEGGITKMQKHLDAVNFAVTENGSRGQKLELISNRLMSQQTNFETLRSENEDIDITEVAIKLSSAELTYSSALMATGKVLQNNLMNFI